MVSFQTMEKRKKVEDLSLARTLAERMRDQEHVTEKDIQHLLGPLYTILYPKEDTPRESRSTIEKREKNGGQKYFEFFFSTLMRTESGTIIDLVMARETVELLLQNGATEEEARKQVGEEIWLLLFPPPKKKEKGKK